ncbi:unnamed protein product [Linum trigynum]|uniref:Uncharacterized protein n=1 Tax=Linum trigynum TaxID=586398 RepID=A0AAV2DPC1_9ROSI
MVFFSSKQLHYSDSPSLSPQSDGDISIGVATPPTEDHHDHGHQLAAEVPKKRTGRTEEGFQGDAPPGLPWREEPQREQVVGLPQLRRLRLAPPHPDLTRRHRRQEGGGGGRRDVPPATAADEEEHSIRSTTTTAADDVYSYCVEEEELEVVDLPRLLSEMAEGLLLSPPPSYVESCNAEERDWWLWNH